MPSFIVTASIKMPIKLGKNSFLTKGHAARDTTTKRQVHSRFCIFKSKLSGRLDIYILDIMIVELT